MTAELYPIKLIPYGVWKPWGDNGLVEHFGRSLPPNLTGDPPRNGDGVPMGWGESWEVSDHDEGMTHVADGPLAGMSFKELTERYGPELLDPEHHRTFPGRFPLLAKLIDAARVLSVQVHPDAHTARSELGEASKTEAWYVIYAGENARAWCGTQPGVTADDLRRSFASDDPLACLHWFTPEAGQTIFIPARTIHTVRDVVFAEIQQNSDTTLRLHDFADRPVDVEWGVHVVDYARGPVDPLPAPPDDVSVATILECGEFVIRRIRVDGSLTQNTTESGVQILMILHDGGSLAWRGEEYPLAMGESILAPASLGEYELRGSFDALQYYLPRT